MFDNELMGIKPGTSKRSVLCAAINRKSGSVSDKLRRTFSKEFEERSSTGYVRDRNVTSLLEAAWPKHQHGKIPTVAQLLAYFAAGRDLIKTFVKEPPRGYAVDTLPILKIPPEGIKLALFWRVSSDPQEKEGNGLLDQKLMSTGHLFKYKDCEQTIIPEEGIPCFSEANSAWSGPSHALLHLLNDPKLSRLDANGKCIHINTLVWCFVDRVGRNLEDFDIIEATFRERGVSIWCLHERIGTMTHLKEFRRRIKRAEDASTLSSAKIKLGKRVKGLQNCSPHEPTAKGDGWGPLKDARLINFIPPHDNIPPEYYIAATIRTPFKIK
jgi:DNA invertase Pin-like site-specific DNA recombinase